jgi:hypothetical protein
MNTLVAERRDDHSPSAKGLAVHVLTSVLLGWGILLLASPIFLYWFIHGSSERYLWLIGGPAPFDSFGSGPFQLWMYAGLFLLGLVLTSASAIGWSRRAR